MFKTFIVDTFYWTIERSSSTYKHYFGITRYEWKLLCLLYIAQRNIIMYLHHIDNAAQPLMAIKSSEIHHNWFYLCNVLMGEQVGIR